MTALPSTCEACSQPAASRCSRCQAASYCSTNCQRQHWPQHKLDCGPPLFELGPSLTAGLGMFASVTIAAGQVILTEKAFLTVPSPITEEVLASLNLEPEILEQLLCLHTGPAQDQQTLLARATMAITYNAFNNGGLNKLSYESQNVYWNLSRVNHACVPNAEVVPAGYSPSCGHPRGDGKPEVVPAGQFRAKLVALSPIPAGQEIFIDYLGAILNSYDHRRQSLQTQFGFECHCWVCSQGPQAKINLTYEAYSTLKMGIIRKLLPLAREEIAPFFAILERNLAMIFPSPIIYESNQFSSDLNQLKLWVEARDYQGGRSTAQRMVKQGRWIGQPEVLEFVKGYLERGN